MTPIHPEHPPGDHIHFPEVAWPEPLQPLAAPAVTVDATAALAALAEAEAIAHALAATMPRRLPLLRRLAPTTATAFWMAAALWLGFLLARAEGWL
jgi:hypothetical protein